MWWWCLLLASTVVQVILSLSLPTCGCGNLNSISVLIHWIMMHQRECVWDQNWIDRPIGCMQPANRPAHLSRLRASQHNQPTHADSYSQSVNSCCDIEMIVKDRETKKQKRAETSYPLLHNSSIVSNQLFFIIVSLTCPHIFVFFCFCLFCILSLLFFLSLIE